MEQVGIVTAWIATRQPRSRGSLCVGSGTQVGVTSHEIQPVEEVQIFFMVLIFVFLSQFTLCFHIVYQRRKQGSFHLPPAGKGLIDSILS